MEKYRPLRSFLVGQAEPEVRLSLREIESILGASLPHSASVHAAWWSNQTPPTPQCRVWMEAGWLAYPNLRTQVVVFRRADANVSAQRQPRDEGAKEAEHNGLPEDEVKAILERYLNGSGWKTTVARGSEHGIDIDAFKDREHWVIEVKGCGSSNPMRVNYFLQVVTETLQRMNDPNAKYSIALPDIQQFRRLWGRFPALAKHRTGLNCLFVSREGDISEVS